MLIQVNFSSGVSYALILKVQKTTGSTKTYADRTGFFLKRSRLKGRGYFPEKSKVNQGPRCLNPKMDSWKWKPNYTQHINQGTGEGDSDRKKLGGLPKSLLLKNGIRGRPDDGLAKHGSLSQTSAFFKITIQRKLPWDSVSSWT